MKHGISMDEGRYDQKEKRKKVVMTFLIYLETASFFNIKTRARKSLYFF